MNFTASYYLIGLITLLSIVSVKPNTDTELTVINLNIRYDNPNDGKNQWENRIPIIKSFFIDSSPDLIGFQEVTHRQLLDLIQMLPAYGFAGKGRKDGLEGGEYNPIFYRKDRFTLLDKATFWLSDTPEKPGSIGWDAQLPRIVTWVKLKDKESGKIIFHFNTHVDNRGVEARFKSVDLLALKIKEIAGDVPVIATGDFNIRKDHPRYGKEPYIYLIETMSQRLQMESAEFAAENVISAGATGNGFEEDWQQRPPNAVDYIFVNPHLKVSTYQVDKIIRDGIFIADHWPVLANVMFSNP